MKSARLFQSFCIVQDNSRCNSSINQKAQSFSSLLKKDHSLDYTISSILPFQIELGLIVLSLITQHQLLSADSIHFNIIDHWCIVYKCNKL